ncbi:MAG: TauD/TfdA family dioxygenase [Gammaproteobacteria bacterium]|nr:TauD/TfdA family dioxygenase [Gammaproteobacteria bacterium]
MNPLHIEPLNTPFGARVTGLDLTTEFCVETQEAIREAIDTWSLLCFVDQPMTDEAHLAFTRQLGEPEAYVSVSNAGKAAELITIGNVVDDGSVQDSAHARIRYQTGNEMWHSDCSFRRVPSFVTITHAYEVPGEGGETSFASMRHAYAGLSADMRSLIDPLLAIHDFAFSRSQVAPVPPIHAASLPPVEQKLVRSNPGNGLKNYYVGSHARSIVGWAGIESRKLIDDLLKRATAPEVIYKHRWNVGDTLIWDNRCLLHRGNGYDADRWRRRLRQTRVAGLSPTLEEP